MYDLDPRLISCSSAKNNLNRLDARIARNDCIHVSSCYFRNGKTRLSRSSSPSQGPFPVTCLVYNSIEPAKAASHYNITVQIISVDSKPPRNAAKDEGYHCSGIIMQGDNTP